MSPSSKPPTPQSSASRGTGTPHAERVYQDLRARLLRGDVPAAERLVELRLADEYDTSRTPVREALRRLEGDGHLVRDASGGLRPRVPDVKTMHELYDVRLALEDLTVRRATTAGDREILYALKAEWERLGELRQTASQDEQPDFVAADEAFHLGIAAASGNEAARAYLLEITERIHVLRIQGFTIETRVDATVDEHLEILEAMLSGDADIAAGFMRAHVLRNAQVVRTLVGEALARMFANH